MGESPQYTQQAEDTLMTDHLSGGMGNGTPAAAGGAGQTADVAPDKNLNTGTNNLTQEQLYALQEQINASQGENAQLKNTLDRMRSALVGDDRQQSDEPDMSWYDDVLRVALEAEKAGRGIPITVDLATRIKGQTEENRDLKRQVAMLAAQVNKVSNPETLHNLRAYENIDDHIFNSLEKLYGEVDPQFSQFVSAKLSQDLKQIQKENPDAWAKIRGSDTLQQRLVNNAIQSAIPKQVRGQLEQDYYKNSPMTLDELAQAYAQADQEIKDPRIREEVKTKARQEYFANSIGSKKGQSFVGRVNKFRGY
jgi:hypothetical protein